DFFARARYFRIGRRHFARLFYLGAARMVLAQVALRRKLAGGEPAHRRARLLLGDVGLAGPPSEFVVRLDQQPRLGLLAAARPHAHQMPASLQPIAEERDVEMALGEALVGVRGRLPAPVIPYDHGAAAVFALRDVALEIE